MLEIHEVTKRFGELTAVNNVSLTVERGQIHSFLGPNGAGKTTTIRMCTGLLRPDSGYIRVAGQDVVEDGDRSRSSLAYVPDEPYLYERLTGREFLEFTARVYEVEPAVFQQRLAEVSERFSLHGF